MIMVKNIPSGYVEIAIENDHQNWFSPMSSVPSRPRLSPTASTARRCSDGGRGHTAMFKALVLKERNIFEDDSMLYQN